MLNRKICKRCQQSYFYVSTRDEWFCSGRATPERGKWVKETDNPPKFCQHLFEQAVYSGMTPNAK